MLLPYYNENLVEAGCDEAGRGCLAGPVFAAAVILPQDICERNTELAQGLNDSKQLTAKKRYMLREQIERDAIAWAVGVVSPQEIDEMNILRASITAMHRAVDQLKVRPEALIIDGNRFYNETSLPYQCIVKGDAKYMPVAAASILAKTHRDEIMLRLHEQYPQYGWDRNKGYPTADHFSAIEQHGPSPLHRRSFSLYRQHTLFENQ